MVAWKLSSLLLLSLRALNAFAIEVRARTSYACMTSIH
jgi:hypothetical protein